MSDKNTLPIEYELLKEVIALDLKILDTKIASLDEEIVHVRITLEDEPDILATCSWGLIYAIGVCRSTMQDHAKYQTSTTS